MAEAVAALALAGNVFQFIDFGFRFIAQAWKLYQTGADGAEAVPTLQGLTKDLQDVLANLQSSQAGDSPTMARLCEDCSRVARRLLEFLSMLNLPEKGRKRDAIKAAFKTVWNRDEIKALQQELDGFRQQLTIHLLYSLRQITSKSAVEQEAVLLKLGSVTQEIGKAIDAASTKQEAIGMSVLDVITSKVSSASRDTYKNALQQDLLRKIYQEDRSEQSIDTPSDEQVLLSSNDREALESKFLSRLRFIGMDDREVRIADTYESTFQWVFKDPPQTYNRTWSNFCNFLESDDKSLYWITGKAGSGKSTLMKFIAYEKNPDYVPSTPIKRIVRHRRPGLESTTMCYQFLSRWAGDAKLYSAIFYFWNSGVQMLTTQAGLYRSIIYQLLSQAPWLIPQVAASRWEALCLFGEDPKDMFEEELRAMLIATIRQLAQKGKLCLFIDGLDEFELGDDKTPVRLIELVFDLIKDMSPNVKICVSSRPWVDFENAFGSGPHLRLENLTHEDIKHYVSSKFSKDKASKELSGQEPDFADELIGGIVQKSRGVFLWVSLVVSSLLDGLRYGDRVLDLQKRLDQLPEKLESLYERILLSLDPLFLEETAQYFTLVRNAQEPISILLLSFMDEECPKFVLNQPIGELPDTAKKVRVDNMRKRLNHRSKGLLEVDQENSLEAEATVQYLHRTVKDYIESEDAHKITKLETKKDFDYNLSFCAGYLSLIKTVPQSRLHRSELPWLIQQCLNAATGTRQWSKDDTMLVLDELDKTGSTLARQVAASPVATLQLAEEIRLLLASGVWVLVECPTFEPKPLNYNISHPQPANFGRTFLSLAVRYGFADYVASRTNRGGLVQRASIVYDKKISFGHKPTVRHTVWPLLLDAILAVDVDMNIVHILLHLGADPNFRVMGNPDHSPWVKAVEWAILRYRGYFGVSRASHSKPWASETETLVLPETSASSSQRSSFSASASSWMDTDWMQMSWAALYEGEWSVPKEVVYRKVDPGFLKHPPCGPVVREMISHGGFAKSSFLLPIIRRMCGASGYHSEAEKILKAFRDIRQEVLQR